MKEYLKNYVEENIKLIIIILVSICLGVIVGIVCFNMFDVGVKNEFVSTIKTTLDLSKKTNFDSINITKNGFISNLLLVVILYFFSITLFAPIFTSALNFFKGVSIGIYLTSLIMVFNIKNAILAIILLVVIPNIFFIPAFTYLSVNSINLHYMLFENMSTKNTINIVIQEIVKFIVAFSVLYLSVVIEQLLSSVVLKLY